MKHCITNANENVVNSKRVIVLTIAAYQRIQNCGQSAPWRNGWVSFRRASRRP